jgi:hypothetical protein
MPIELLLTVRDEPLKGGIGLTFFTSGLATENALAVALNRHKLLVSKALSKADTLCVTFFCALLIAECLALRGSESPLVRRLQETLSRPLYAPNRLERSQVLCDFAMRLSLSPVLEKLKTLPIYGPTPREDTHAVAIVELAVSPLEVKRNGNG